MMRVQLGILAAPEIAVTFLQIVGTGLKPRAEAVATKRCDRPEIVMNEIAPGRDRSAWKGGELQCLGHGLLPDLCIHPTATPTAVFDQDQKGRDRASRKRQAAPTGSGKRRAGVSGKATRSPYSAPPAQGYRKEPAARAAQSAQGYRCDDARRTFHTR